MDKTTFLAWLCAWVIGVFAFLAPLFAGMLMSEVRRLRRLAAPRPFFLLSRRLLRHLPAWRGDTYENLIGSEVLLAWICAGLRRGKRWPR
jgi:hypothetical protein